MKKLILAVVLAFCINSALAETFVARNGAGDTAWITDAPCTNDTILEVVRAQLAEHGLTGDLPAFFAGNMDLAAHGRHNICWTFSVGGDVVIAYEDGKGALIPRSHFALEPGI